MQTTKKILISEAWLNCNDGNVYITEHSSFGDSVYLFMPYEHILSFDLNIVKSISYTSADTKQRITTLLSLNYLNTDLSNNLVFNKTPSIYMIGEVLHEIVRLGFINETLILPFKGLLSMQLNLDTCKLIETTPSEVSVQHF